MELESVLTIKKGNLKEAFSQRILPVDELVNCCCNSSLFKPTRYFCAEENFYYLDKKNGEPKLAIVQPEDGLFFRNISSAYGELVRTGKYRPDKKEAMGSINAEKTAVVSLNYLDLKKSGSSNYLSIRTNPRQYHLLNSEGRKIGERVCGEGNDFIRNMAALAQAKIWEVRVYFLPLEEVVKEAEEGPIVLASSLQFNFRTMVFNAAVHTVNVLHNYFIPLSEIPAKAQ